MVFPGKARGTASRAYVPCTARGSPSHGCEELANLLTASMTSSATCSATVTTVAHGDTQNYICVSFFGSRPFAFLNVFSRHHFSYYRFTSFSLVTWCFLAVQTFPAILWICFSLFLAFPLYFFISLFHRCTLPMRLHSHFRCRVHILLSPRKFFSSRSP